MSGEKGRYGQGSFKETKGTRGQKEDERSNEVDFIGRIAV
ncbi:hypothetical protein BRO54_3212 [Geobacillus proteiniphilus]|uniref:Uncharacterized protein n=1 Tax=Geobacillus proteiniphilus TaxID=860353 RepID=A0A1Q5SPC9_9BACL|nr:hypothetical protein BRO54_3212 [Geobacillus proteiniphilus]